MAIPGSLAAGAVLEVDTLLLSVNVPGATRAKQRVGNCLGKLGLATRAGLAAWAVERGLSAAPAEDT